MATVCGSSLALMDAGVPLKRACAGIAHGSHFEGKDSRCCRTSGDGTISATWTSKVPGTESGVTSLQMDIKITGITERFMRVALNQAREGACIFLGEMVKAIGVPVPNSASMAPRIETIKIPTDKIAK